MARIYQAPKQFKLPLTSFFRDDWEKQIEDYIERVRDWCKSYHKGEYIGEVITFSVADGRAYYMVFSEKPLKLLHLPIGDCWEFPYVHRLTLKEVKQKVASQKALDRLFQKV